MAEDRAYHITTATIAGEGAKDINGEHVTPGMHIDTFELYLTRGQEKDELESQLDWDGFYTGTDKMKTVAAFYISDDGTRFGLVTPPPE